jgi:hypothetical protein
VNNPDLLAANQYRLPADKGRLLNG